MTTHWTDLALEVGALRKKKLPLHPALPKPKAGKKPKPGKAKKKFKIINGVKVEIPTNQAVWQDSKNSARSSYTPAQVREMRRAYAGTREDRIYSGISLRVVKR